jgi:hypothetical protein
MSVYSSPVGVVAGDAGGAGGRCAPPWCSSTTNALTPCSWRSFSTSALTVWTSGRNSSPATADGVTTVGVPSNVSPMNATLALPTLCTSYGGRTVVSVSAKNTFAARYSKIDPPNGVPSWQPSTGWQPSPPCWSP